MNKHEIEQFAKNVLYYCRAHGWAIRFKPNSSEGYCWRSRKIIDIGEEAYDPKKLVLHEIAHIGTCRFCNNQHARAFWRQYEFLLHRFLPGAELDEHELYHRSLSEDVGFYRICYRSDK